MMDPVNLLLTVLIILLAAGLGGIGMLIYQSGKTGSNVEANSKKAQNAVTQKKMEYPKEDIQKFKKYYAIGEELCTFSGGRLNNCYVFFAVKKNISWFQVKRRLCCWHILIPFIKNLFAKFVKVPMAIS